jgi:alpha(1,3/1,4) fucosyltransferase
MIRLCRIARHAFVKEGHFRQDTPFDHGHHEAVAFFQSHGIVFTENPLRCDLLVASHVFPPWWNTWKRKGQLLLRYPFGRHFLIWSDEPYNIDPPTFRWSRLQPVAHVMNVYTRDVFLSNFNMHWAIKRDLPFKKLEDCPEQGKAKIVGVVGYIPSPKPRIVQGIDRDLNWLRMAFLKEGWERRRVDIYGSDWPNNMSKEDSRSGNWWDRKIAVLREYDICMSLENTNFDYYCTEKIWQSIAGGCLPIYYGNNNRIYDTFPRRSFIDASEFSSVKEIYEYIDSMPQHEYYERYNRCVEVNNSIRFDSDAERKLVLGNIVRRIDEILGRMA